LPFFNTVAKNVLGMKNIEGGSICPLHPSS
jgi:hypothetical protein